MHTHMVVDQYDNTDRHPGSPKTVTERQEQVRARTVILALVTTKRIPPGKMAAPGNVLGGNAPDKDHISCGNDSCGCDTKRGDPTKRPTTIYDVVKSGYVAYFCIFITTFEMAPTPSLPVLTELYTPNSPSLG